MDAAITVAKDQMYHLHHPDHSPSLVHVQPREIIYEDYFGYDSEREKDDKYDFVEEERHFGECKLCKEHIWSFYSCYYKCGSCDYSSHKFCEELPNEYRKHPLHPDHNLLLSSYYGFEHKCTVCNSKIGNLKYYYCTFCKFRLDIICATMSERKINHPSHPHELERIFWPIVSNCVACGNKHDGVFFHCTTCPTFWINLDCALLPLKLLIQNHTNGTFYHSHPLTLRVPYGRYGLRASKPYCNVCDGIFDHNLWAYECDHILDHNVWAYSYGCDYHIHVSFLASKKGVDVISKNYIEDEHPNLLQCPFQDEGDNLLKRHMSNQKGKQHDGEMPGHDSHQHTLINVSDNKTLVGQKIASLHNPMKRIQLLCDGCVKPIMTTPFYVCCQDVDEQCCFVLHEWCAKLPSQVQDYVGHPEHTLHLISNIPSKFFSVFQCAMCELPSNGFVYGCAMCEYYVDINCAFIPKEITHDAHPNHLLSIVLRSGDMYCKACRYGTGCRWGFHCPSCEFYIHAECALLLPKSIKHRCDIHPLTIRYKPVDYHSDEYFCEICENELNPWKWFYHCTICAYSMHAECVPAILQCEQATYGYNIDKGVYKFLNVKFGGTLEIKGHSHRFAFVQGLESDGMCIKCGDELRCEMIFKCLECEYAFHYKCVESFIKYLV